MQQQNLFEDAIKRLNENTEPKGDFQTIIQIIFESYFQIIPSEYCNDLKEIFYGPGINGIVNENLIKHLYFDEQLFPSGRYSALEETISKLFCIEDIHADINRKCLGRLHKKFDFASKYLSLCIKLINIDINHGQPDPEFDPSSIPN